MTRPPAVTKEMGLFFAALAFIISQAAQLTSAGASIADPGDLKVSDSAPSIVVPPIDKKDDVEAFLAGQRENPFARPGTKAPGDFALLDPVKPPLQTAPKPPPPPQPKPAPKETPPAPKPPAPPPQPKPAEPLEPKQPKPYELPVSLAGVMTVDGVRRVVLQIKDNQYYLTMLPGEKIDALGIEVVSVDGEEVTLKSTNTGETFLLRDLIEKLKKSAGTGR